jgi:hypothetical protein
VCLDKVTGAQGAVEGQFTCEHTGGDDARELACVVTGRFRVRATDTEKIEHGGLGVENGAAADGADFDRGHGDGDLEVTVDAGSVSFM